MKVAVSVTLLVRSLMTQTVPLLSSHPDHPPNVPLVATAVSVRAVPVGKLPVHAVALEAQPRPEGELDMVPVPVPAKSTVTVGPVPLKQVTFAVI